MLSALRNTLIVFLAFFVFLCWSIRTGNIVLAMVLVYFVVTPILILYVICERIFGS